MNYDNYCDRQNRATSQPIQFGWSRVGNPSSDPALDLALVKRALRLATDAEYTEDDAMLTAHINSAVSIVEEQAEVCLLPRTMFYWANRLPRRDSCDNLIKLRLEQYPINEITHIKYYDDEDTLQTLDPSYYYVLPQTPPLLVLTPTKADFPTLFSRTRLDRWQVTCECGFEDFLTQCPAAFTAVTILVGYYFRNPEDQGRTPPSSSSADRAFKDAVENLRWRAYP